MMLKVLSLGAGVQSSTCFLMSCLGELPKLDAAVFADTGWEPQAVYEHLEWLKTMGTKYSIPVYRVSKGNIRADTLRSQVRGKQIDGVRGASMPFRTIDQQTGSEGMIKRQCTSEYKIEPIETFVKRELLGIPYRGRAPTEPVVELWQGISRDEAQRMKPSRVKWARKHFPLIFDVPMYRGQCLEWLEEHFPERDVPRSACIGCPYHSNEEWRHIRDESPVEWQDAIEFDRAIRNAGGMRGKLYVHRDCVPLEDADLSEGNEHQADLFGNECEGMCGV